MVETDPNISIITVKENGLNLWVKRTDTDTPVLKRTKINAVCQRHTQNLRTYKDKK